MHYLISLKHSFNQIKTYTLRPQGSRQRKWFLHGLLSNLPHTFKINPIALRKAKIVYNFGLSECNRVNENNRLQSRSFQKPKIFLIVGTPVRENTWANVNIYITTEYEIQVHVYGT